MRGMLRPEFGAERSARIVTTNFRTSAYAAGCRFPQPVIEEALLP